MSQIALHPLPPFKPPLHTRAWSSTPHPTLPLLATAHDKQVTVYSLSTLTKHSSLTGGHTRSVRCAAWKPGLPSGKLCLVTGSFDATAGLWRWDGPQSSQPDGDELELDVSAATQKQNRPPGSDDRSEKEEEEEEEEEEEDWEFTLVLEGHENEIKSASFSPSGQFLATSSRDKTVWIWEDVGSAEGDDEWETVAVLSDHDGDVKAVAWAPDTPGRNKRGRYGGGADVLATASYDDTVRVWREDGEGEWVCVAVLEGHGGTVWGVQWEGRPRREGDMPRLMSWSADGTVRVWRLVEEEEEEEREEGWGGGGIPNTMRRGLREEWVCEAVLPRVHGRDVYSATWSAQSGRVASTGSDGVVAVYEEVEGTGDGDAVITGEGKEAEGRWRVLGTVANAHGPYEVNHVTWCKRFDAGADRKGVEEMLVTTGDDGTVRPWQIIEG
ncbi:WD repeat protein [Coniochaeta hoffmannii]|uniref:Probable cytosolic iron-sulfur protein assembly protein 1 n=1 Tax=Coniochaeta hoffmannii TaxID=91930 RepID=A0AA38RUM9_9PEZI|nr:WD repeat protein [Coniochaeta hoffmannii]